MQDIKDNGGLYVVTNSMAHAWTEVLLLPEEDLWTTVDRTPPRPPVPEDIPYVALSSVSTEEKNTMAEDNNIESIQENTDGAGLNFTLSWKSVSMVVASLMLVAIFYILFRLMKFFWLKKAALYSDSMIPVYYYAKRKLKTVGNDSTLYKDDMKWLKSIEDPELKIHIKIMVDGAYEEFFGKREVKGFNKYKLYCTIENHIRKKQNFLIYYLKKYFV